ncbi:MULTISPECIES: hypothetical protein [Clostridium]|uniref:Uncharacterized protein n=1 Tax=Clostridium cibarium TaxID=2762247 RepID=A0ABR8PWB9_9CLOT|nr:MULTISPECIES: hypothetical protein [Clostridium]MBD7912449.1 hypothetical protein [Clostridium cibarium]
MNKLALERIYAERGLEDYKLRTLDDLFYIYGVKVNQIEGYFKLKEEEKSFFNRFIINYFNSYGLEGRNISIIKVAKLRKTLRVEFIDNGKWRVGDLEFGIRN